MNNKHLIIIAVALSLLTLYSIWHYPRSKHHGIMTSEEASWMEWQARQDIDFQLLTTDEFNERVNGRLERGENVCIYYDEIEKVKWFFIPHKWVLYTGLGYRLG